MFVTRYSPVTKSLGFTRRTSSAGNHCRRGKSAPLRFLARSKSAGTPSTMAESPFWQVITPFDLPRQRPRSYARLESLQEGCKRGPEANCAA